MANAEWDVQGCPRCGRHRAALVAHRHIPAGAEVTVVWNPSRSTEDSTWPWEVTFDGGARRTALGPLAGAGAVLWQHTPGGAGPVQVAETTVALPWNASAQLAEAYGCRAALELLDSVDADCRRARIVGDNLAVVRYGAATAGLRAPPATGCPGAGHCGDMRQGLGLGLAGSA